jgi:NADPH2:quinone reductase
MRRVETTGPGGPEVLVIRPAPVPEPGPAQVLIHVQAAGVNRPDIAQRKGHYPPPKDADPHLGLEVAGTVAACGKEVAAWHVGDKVCALVNGGGYAEYCLAPEGQCLPWPTGYDAIRASALPETFFTVWANLFGHGGLQPGQTALVHGGTSGIGTTAIALARAFGARVIVTAGSDAKCSACEKLGALAINYKTKDFVGEVHRLTGDRGVDVVLDMVAGPYLSRNVNCLAKDGRLVVIATQGGFQDPDFNILPVMVKRLVITGSTMRPRSAAEKAVIAHALRERVWPLLSAGKCAPIIDSLYTLDDVAEAHRRLESGAHLGKIVMHVA